MKVRVYIILADREIRIRLELPYFTSYRMSDIEGLGAHGMIRQ